MESIPVIAVDERFESANPARGHSSTELCHALMTAGFAYIVDHGVPGSVIEAAFAASREFHASPLVLKESIRINGFHRGYMGIATSTIVTSSVARVTQPNLSESLMLMHELAPDDPAVVACQPLQGPNQWPAWLPGFRPAIEDYLVAINGVARRLVRAIATGLGLTAEALDRHFVRPTTFLRLLHECDAHTLLRLPTGLFYAQGVKANVLFFDKKPASETPWTKKLWIYDLRTNKHFTLKTDPLKREDLDEFVRLYHSANRHERTPTWSAGSPEGRWRVYEYDELLARDKASLDIFWLRDESLADSDNLPPPEVIAQEIVEDLEAALEQFRLIAGDLGGEDKADERAA